MRMKFVCCVIAAVSALCIGAALDRSVSADTEFAKSELDLEAAMRLVHAAVEESRKRDLAMDIAVVDATGYLKAFARMDGAFLGSVDISQRKARTSVLFQAPTSALSGLTQPGQPLYGLEHTNGGLVTFGGGIPLRNKDGKLIGAIGVSGSSVENDVAVAEAGVSAL